MIMFALYYMIFRLMNIFKHNYLILSEKDIKYLEDWEKWKKKCFQSEPSIGFIGMDDLALWEDKIHKNKAIQHYFSLFPNNFLCGIDYQKNYKAIYSKKLANFSKLLDKKDIG